MSALSIRLPASLHERVRELAAREGISINQLVATALAEKMAAMMTEEYLDARARRGDRNRYLAALASVPDVQEPETDRYTVAPKKTAGREPRAASASGRVSAIRKTKRGG
jgi:hypothetical protein